MRLMIEGPDGVILECGSAPDALLPYDDSERTQAFEALTDALALLAGLMPRSIGAREAVTDAHSAGSVQFPADRRSDDVVNLSERRAFRDARWTLE